MSIIFTKAIPVLASLDFDATEAFYQQKLGFATAYKSDDYLIMNRADLVLHFWACDDKNIAESTSCYINVEGVDELYVEYEQVEVIHPHPNAKVQDHAHGMREFAIVDGDGINSRQRARDVSSRARDSAASQRRSCAEEQGAGIDNRSPEGGQRRTRSARSRARTGRRGVEGDAVRPEA